MIWIAFSVLLSFLTIVGDYYVKRAGLGNRVGWISLFSGVAIYLIVAISWFFVFRHLKLATIGVIYGVSCLLFLTLLGMIFFKERLNFYEIIGVAMAIASILLLARFSNL